VKNNRVGDEELLVAGSNEIYGGVW